MHKNLIKKLPLPDRQCKYSFVHCASESSSSTETQENLLAHSCFLQNAKHSIQEKRREIIMSSEEGKLLDLVGPLLL